MTKRQNISTYISRIVVSIVVLMTGSSAYAQNNKITNPADTMPLLKGMQISVDIAGPIIMQLSDYGEYEAALRLNLKNKYFPIFELGYGMAEHLNDEVTGISYETSAPYFRIGCDLNLLKNKNSENHFYGGIRYAFTTYKVDMSRNEMQDPVWGNMASFNIEGESCNQHWIEVVFGIDSKIWGPLHLGWNVRYKRRIAHKDSSAGNTWYIPGFGKYGDTRLGANFNVTIDI
ncbi:MAG: hypothetical protein IKK92_04060 [Prevotella sp.]|nr:hypothetical protein [Prevotella sp.]MBR6591502.1 hypothetical protein [Prevotella sp.]MBR6605029.1 hypothetical protein [Prevotella sp.]